MSFGFSKKIINLSRHSFTDKSDQNVERGRRFSNINTEAVIYNNEHLQQLYTGLYLDESLHNVGTYRWLFDGDSLKYEGKLFLNHLHGYGKLQYADDSLFEGLFYFNKRFGPGVITYTNKTQDIGLWNGNYLIRLCEKFSVSEYYLEGVPKLSGYIQSKLYLLQFKHLIPISKKYKDPAADILKKLGASDQMLANKNKLYSKCVRNPKSMFANEEKLYKNFFTYEDELHTLVDVIDHFDENGKPVIVKLEVRNLIAWNNEEINMAILKHAFLNRHHENLLSYKIKDILCAKNRGAFLPPGPIETKSRELLMACRVADSRPVKKLIVENDIYPDVADCRGNNTITYATLAYQNDIIKVLSEFGANLNNFNDDSVTPLMFAILQYISIKYDVSCKLWEFAFIYNKIENKPAPCNQQWPPSSTTRKSSINKNSSKSKSSLESEGLSETSRPSNTSQTNFHKTGASNVNQASRRESFVILLQDYILSLDCSHLPRAVNIRKSFIDANMRTRKSIVPEISVTYEYLKNEEYKKITQTISTLLLCGANPNIGEVPFCPIITSIFAKSKSLIQMLLSFNASIDVKTCEYLGKLGPLHVIASLSPCVEQLEMAFIFLENGAYVDDYSNKIHWPEEQNILLADKTPEDYLEKTPLHIICMRYGFNDDTDHYLIKLALMFIQYGANLSSKYLGHTPLTLAMMRGNTELMESLLETGLVDPNEALGYNMGVPLTVCILNRYNKLWNNFIVQQIYSILTEFYANPLNDVPNFNGNAVEFYYHEFTFLRSSRRFSVLNRTNAGTILADCAKNTLLKHIESKVVQILYHYKIIYDFDSALYNNIVKYLNYKRTLEILQILIDHDEIQIDHLNFQKLLNFVDKKESYEKNNNLKENKSSTKFHLRNDMPEVDPDDLKYEVCFECLRKTDQLLMLCPKCEMVYFCSAECNKKNFKNPNSAHPCQGNFYEHEKRNKRRSTKIDHLKQKSLQLEMLLSFGNIDLEEYSKMQSKEKRSSIEKLKKKREKQTFDQNTDNAKTISSTGSEELYDQKRNSKVQIATIKKAKKTKATSKNQENVDMKSAIKTAEKTKVIDKNQKSSPYGKNIKSGKKSQINGKKTDNAISDKTKSDQTFEDNPEEVENISSMQKLELIMQKAKLQHAEEIDELSTDKESKGKKKKRGKKIGKEKKKDGQKSVMFSSHVSKKVIMSDNIKKSRKLSEKRQSKPSKKNASSVKHEKITSMSKKAKSTEKSSKKSQSKPSTITDFGENVNKKINLPFKKKIFKDGSSTKPDVSVFVGSKIPVINMEKRNMYLKLRAQMLERDRELNAKKNKLVQSQCFREKLKMDKNCTERMLELARKRIPNFPVDYEELDVKFWQFFAPYCIFENGQLYYNFNEQGQDVFYKITYSSV